MQYFKTIGIENFSDKEKVKDNFIAVCKKGQELKEVSQRVKCVHGIGHIAMYLSNNSVKDSLVLSDLYDSQIYRYDVLWCCFYENY